MIVFACDPGLGTGLAWYNTVNGDYGAEEVIGFYECCTRFDWHLNAFDEIEAVCESFTINQRTTQLTQQYDAIWLIGVLKNECFKMNIPLTMQNPSARKAAEKNLLKKMGWFVKTKDGHRNSASAHLLTYLIKQNSLTPDDKMRLMQ